MNSLNRHFNCETNGYNGIPGQSRCTLRRVSTAEFGDGDSGLCKFIYQYIPFYALPLIESSAINPAFSIPDDSHDDGISELVRCKRDAYLSEMGSEEHLVSRHSRPQDRTWISGHDLWRRFEVSISSGQAIICKTDNVPGRWRNGSCGTGQTELRDSTGEKVEVRAASFTLPPEFTTHIWFYQQANQSEGERKENDYCYETDRDFILGSPPVAVFVFS